MGPTVVGLVKAPSSVRLGSDATWWWLGQFNCARFVFVDFS
jgi:hypothetical protein